MMKITLITGATGGLGYEFAKLFGKDGNNLLLLAPSVEELEIKKKDLQNLYPNIFVDTYCCDLSEISNYKKVLEYTKEKEYFVNNLVNNAGFGDRCDFKDMNIDKQIAMTNVCCNCVLYFTRVFLDDMLKNDEGHIINISSIAGFYPGPYMSTYHAVKSYVLNLGESVSFELRKTNVKLLTLCPGPFESNFVKYAHNDYTFSLIKPIKASQVAAFGYKKSLKGASVATVGVKNRLTHFASRFVSRKMLAKSSAKTLKKDI